MIRLVNQMIARAVETQASDIHIEPFEDRLRVRYRYDGVLHEAESPPARLASAITSRITGDHVAAGYRRAAAARRTAGRIGLAVAAWPGGGSARLHHPLAAWRDGGAARARSQRRRVGLRSAWPATRDRSKLAAAFDLPNGIVLVTGPTGSGKTTTLYTGYCSRAQLGGDRKIVTVEDPIEYQLAGINQIQVKPQIQLTFASLLRSILRQDPDVIMVGEIRDLETAQIAAQAALTGHLVLSTLHTNSAAASITRLRDMGLEDYLLTAVLRGTLAQRLVRRLCTACRQPQAAPAELVQRFGLRLQVERGPDHAVARRRLPAVSGHQGFAAARRSPKFLTPATASRSNGWCSPRRGARADPSARQVARPAIW